MGKGGAGGDGGVEPAPSTRPALRPASCATSRGAGVVPRPGVEPAQPVATVLQTAPLADGGLCMGGAWSTPLGSSQLESLNWWPDATAREPLYPPSAIQSRWLRRDRGPGTRPEATPSRAGDPLRQGASKARRGPRASPRGAPGLIADRLPQRKGCDRPAEPWSAIPAAAGV
jgi:hypothetical protein